MRTESFIRARVDIDVDVQYTAGTQGVAADGARCSARLSLPPTCVTKADAHHFTRVAPSGAESRDSEAIVSESEAILIGSGQ